MLGELQGAKLKNKDGRKKMAEIKVPPKNMEIKNDLENKEQRDLFSREKGRVHELQYSCVCVCV